MPKRSEGQLRSTSAGEARAPMFLSGIPASHRPDSPRDIADFVKVLHMVSESLTGRRYGLARPRTGLARPARLEGVIQVEGKTMTPAYRSALIVGVGDGLSASLARVLAKAGMKVGLSARNTSKLSRLAEELAAPTHACDASQPAAVEALFAAMDEALGGAPDVVVYNPSARVRGPLVELDPAAVERALAARPSERSWSPSKLSSACCRIGTAPCCSPALPQA